MALDYEARIAEGADLVAAGERGRAAELFGTLADQQPARPEAFVHLGLISDLDGDDAAARAYFQKAVSLDAENPPALFNLGVSLGKVQDYAGSASVFERLVALTPDYIDVREKLALLYRMLGRTPDAMAQYAQLRRLAEGDGEALTRVGHGYMALGQIGFAVEAYRAAARKRPDSAEARQLVATALAGAQMPAETVKHYREVLRLEPNNAPVKRLLAEAYLRSGQYIEATEEYRGAYRLQPCTDAAAGLARALFKQERHAEARACLPPVDGELQLVWHGKAREWSERCGGEFRERLEPFVSSIHEVEIAPFLLHARDTTVFSDDAVIVHGDNLLFDHLVADPPRFADKSPMVVLDSEHHLLIRRPRQSVTLDRPAILLGGNDNYHRWFVDHLARLMLIEGEPELSSLPLLVAPGMAAYQRDSLALLGIGEERLLVLERDASCSVSDLWVPSAVTQSSWTHPQAIAWLRRKLARASDKPQRRLFVSREDASWRRLDNEAALFEALRDEGFEKVVPGTLTLEQQIRLFGEAKVVVGPHGAGLANLLFAPASTALVELQSSSYPSNFFNALATGIGQPVHRIVGHVTATDSITPHRWDFAVDASEVVGKVRELL